VWCHPPNLTALAGSPHPAATEGGACAIGIDASRFDSTLSLRPALRGCTLTRLRHTRRDTEVHEAFAKADEATSFYEFEFDVHGDASTTMVIGRQNGDLAEGGGARAKAGWGSSVDSLALRLKDTGI
jgi:hypothetical protein